MTSRIRFTHWIAGLALLLAPASHNTQANDAQAANTDQAPTELRAVPTDRMPTPPPAVFTHSGSSYTVGRQDLLEIRVFGVDELSQTVRVSDDGSITMPLLGRIPVAGRSKSELETQIADLLGANFVHDPQVTIFVKEYESRRVAVTGAIRTPGSYEMLGRKTLIEMISLAGGLDSEMGKEIVIFRPNDSGSTDRISIDLDRLVYAADPTLNLDVAAGDIIYVPAIKKVRIFVTGAVKTPNLYEVPRSEPITVLKAITLAGGTTDRAAQKKVQVMRTDSSGQRISFIVNLRKVKRGKAEDPILREDDIVLVPEAFF